MVVDERWAHEFARNALSVLEDEWEWSRPGAGLLSLLPIAGLAVGDDGRRENSFGAPKVRERERNLNWQEAFCFTTVYESNFK